MSTKLLTKVQKYKNCIIFQSSWVGRSVQTESLPQRADVAQSPPLAFEGAGGAPEALADGAGVVVPFLDTEAMARNVAELIQDGSARHAMGDAARSRAESSCSSMHHFEGIMEVVASTCGIDLQH